MEKHDQFCTQLSTVSPLTVVGDDEEAEKTMEEVSCAPSSDGALRPQKRKKHLKWKKPAGKPHHPRTGYNLFFRFERERILNQMDHMPIASSSVQSIQVHANPRIKEVANILRRRSDSTPGKVGFAGLTRNVAAKWKLLDPKIKEIFERKAAEDKERYKRELEVWQRMEKEKEENASSELELSESQSVNLPVFLMASTQSPSVHRPVFQLASSESQSVADHAIFNFENVEPRSLSDSSPGLSNRARNAVHEFRNNLEHNLFFSTEAQEQASQQHCEIVNQSEHVFPGFSHDDLVGPFFGEQSGVTPSYSRSSESSFPSSSVENRPGRSDGVLPSSIGYFTGEVHNLSSQLQKWMQEEFANSDHLTVQQRQELERQMMSCSDSVRQLLLQLQALHAPMSLPEEQALTAHFDGTQNSRKLSYADDDGSQCVYYHMNQLAKHGFEEGLTSRSLHELAHVDSRGQHCRSLKHTYPSMKDGCASPSGQSLSLRKALLESSSRSANGTSQLSTFPERAVDPRMLFQRRWSDPTGCHSYTPTPHFRYPAAMNLMERHNSVPLREQASALHGGCEEFCPQDFGLMMSDMNQIPVTFEEERFTSEATHRPRFNSVDVSFSDDMVNDLGDLDDTLLFQGERKFTSPFY